jgi:hypothetical protein
MVMLKTKKDSARLCGGSATVGRFEGVSASSLTLTVDLLSLRLRRTPALFQRYPSS